jgi:hypothetical protein
LALDIPVYVGGGGFFWYFYVLSMSPPRRRFLLSLFGDPFLALSLIGVISYGIIIAFLRDRVRAGGYASRLPYFPPSTILREYKRLYGTDVAIKILAGFPVGIVLLFLIGACRIGLR